MTLLPTFDLEVLTRNHQHNPPRHDTTQPGKEKSGKRENEANHSESRSGEDSCPVFLESSSVSLAAAIFYIILSSTWIFKTVLEEKQARVALLRGLNQIETVENA